MIQKTNYQKMLDFVKHWHGDQKRKYTGEPYWHHLVNVSSIVRTVTTDESLILIALGHDLLEDTECTNTELVRFLLTLNTTIDDANIIRAGIFALTDQFTKENFPDMNREARKEAERNRLSLIHRDFQTVKYADLIDNTSSITQHDPNFSKVYMKEKSKLLDVMRDGNRVLFDRCIKIVDNYFE